jgi:uncharacterized protein with HEPN domain
MRNDGERMLDILEAMERIEQYSVRGEAAFRSDELIQSWMARQIQIDGEAARSVSQELRERTPDIPWSKIIGIRHVLVHQYFEIDLDIVWQVIKVDLPSFKGRFQELANALEEE